MITYTPTRLRRSAASYLYMYEMTIPDVKSGSKYNFCLKFSAGSRHGGFVEVARLCKVD